MQWTCPNVDNAFSFYIHAFDISGNETSFIEIEDLLLLGLEKISIYMTQRNEKKVFCGKRHLTVWVRKSITQFIGSFFREPGKGNTSLGFQQRRSSSRAMRKLQTKKCKIWYMFAALRVNVWTTCNIVELFNRWEERTIQKKKKHAK